MDRSRLANVGVEIGEGGSRDRVIRVCFSFGEGGGVVGAGCSIIGGEL